MRTRHCLAWGAGAAAAVAAAGWTLFAARALDRARDAAEACVAGAERAEPDRGGCRPSGWLAVAATIPWQRAAARDLRSTMDRSAAVIELHEATASAPGSARRAAVVDELFAKVASAPPGLRAEALEQATERAVATGAFSDLLRHRDELASAHAPVLVVDIALATADLGVLGAAATSSISDRDASRINLRTGALRCLFGDRTQGGEALAQAENAWRRAFARDDLDDWPEAQEALLACRARGARAGRESPLTTAPERRPFTVAQRRRLVTVRLALGERPAGWRSVFEGLRYNGRARLRALAWSLGEGPLTTPRILTLLGSGDDSRPHAVSARRPSPWSVMAPALGEVADAVDLLEPIALDALERAAIVLGSKSEAMHHDPDASEGWSGDPAEGTGGAHPLSRGARAPGPGPRDTLRLGAWSAWLEAATGWVRRAKRDRARLALAEADRLARELANPPVNTEHEALRSIATVPLHLVNGDAERALKILTALTGAHGFELRDELARGETLLLQSLALVALSRFGDAYEASQRAHRAAWTARASLPAIGELRIETAWLRAALALRTDHTRDELPFLDAPPDTIEVGANAPLSKMQTLAWWWRVARLPPGLRRLRRRTPPSILEAPEAVLPAVLYLAGEAAAGDGEIEVWLDRIFPQTPARLGRLYPLARAEAARWRGDSAASRTWSERADRLLAPLVDDRAAILASAAGL